MKVRDQGGGVFDFVILGVDSVQFELVDIFLELLSSGDAGSSEPVNGFLLDIGISEGFLKIGLESDESPKGLVGKALLAVDFGPHGSGPFLHIGHGIGNLPVVIMVEGLVDEEVEVDRVQPGLGCLCLCIILIRAPNTNLGDPQTGGDRGGSSSRGGRYVQHSDHDW